MEGRENGVIEALARDDAAVFDCGGGGGQRPTVGDAALEDCGGGNGLSAEQQPTTDEFAPPSFLAFVCC